MSTQAEQPSPVHLPGVRSVQAAVAEDVRLREQIGIARYGTALQPPVLRRCKVCGEIKSLEAFEPAKRYRDGRMPRCRSCRAKYRSQLYQRAWTPIGKIKRCRKCDMERDVAQFSMDKRSPDGYAPRCKLCRREDRKSQNPVVVRARILRWKYGISLDEKGRTRLADQPCPGPGGQGD